MTKDEFLIKIKETGIQEFLEKHLALKHIEYNTLWDENGEYNPTTNAYGGYYDSNNNSWTVFFTDFDRGIINRRILCDSENQMYDKLFIRLELKYKAYLTSPDYIIPKYLVEKMQYSRRSAMEEFLSIREHTDIAYELCNYIETGKFESISGKRVKIEGYTAQDLFDNYPLSGLGAYNYLIYLREEPKNALADLKAGLPRR